MKNYNRSALRAIFALAVAGVASIGHAQAPAVYRVTVTQARAVVLDQVTAASVASDARATNAKPYDVKGAACNARNDHPNATANGIGEAGLSVILTPQDSDGRKVTTRAHIESASLVGMASIQIGACAGQTPILAKWDAYASFYLVAGESQEITAGGYVVHVQLVAPASPAPEDKRDDLQI